MKEKEHFDFLAEIVENAPEGGAEEQAPKRRQKKLASSTNSVASQEDDGEEMGDADEEEEDDEEEDEEDEPTPQPARARKPSVKGELKGDPIGELISGGVVGIPDG